jgi:predicted transcriptional regulator
MDTISRLTQQAQGQIPRGTAVRIGAELGVPERTVRRILRGEFKQPTSKTVRVLLAARKALDEHYRALTPAA